jgi:D-3-phosphoglycerate dehydrogenase / 2-oxoglutarate reductase
MDLTYFEDSRMAKVLIADALSPRAVDIFKTHGVEVDVKTGLKPDELKAIIGAYDGLAVRSATKVTADILAAATNLKVVGRAGIGVDTVDLAAATQKGVVVMNTPYGNSITTAEHAVALMMALARQIPQADRSTQAGKWEKSRFMGVELTGKTLGIVGCGNIGSIVADRAQGLKMKVVAFDPFLSAERAQSIGVEKVELAELFVRADFITLHTPLTNETRNMVDAAAIATMKKGVRIVNCARGGLIVEDDLKAALETGHVAGAALDVFLVEPAKENPLFGLDGLIATPHLGASTAEAQENVALQIAEQMSDFLLNGAVANAVNMPNVTAEEAPRLTPYMALAELLGGFLGQINRSGLTAVAIEYQGDVSQLNTRPITASALAGVLRPVLEEVNIVNAPAVARDRDIQVSEVKRDRAAAYQSLMVLTVTTDDGEHRVSGTLIGGTKPRLVEIDGIALEAELGRHMLFVRNQDRPGFIGNLGRALGDAGVNIATFHLGRSAPGEDAILLTEVDQAVETSLLDSVKALPNVVEARALSF